MLSDHDVVMSQYNGIVSNIAILMAYHMVSML